MQTPHIARDSVSKSLPDQANLFLSPTSVLTGPFVSRMALRSAVFDETTGHLRFIDQSVCGAVMIVDICAFSSVAATLAEKGAHALADGVNGYYARITTIVKRYRGDIVKFAGDAMIVMWATKKLSQDCASAAACALTVQEECGSHVVAGLDAPLRLHIGLTCGELQSYILAPRTGGELTQAFHYLGGAPFFDVETVVDSAPPRTVYVTATFAATATDCIKVERTSSLHIFHLRSVSNSAVVSPAHRDSLSSNSMVDIYASEAPPSSPGVWKSENEASVVRELFIPEGVMNKMRAGLRAADMAELRHLHVLFIKKTGDINTADWFEEVYGLLTAARCPIVQIIDDDKGVHVVAAFNLYVSEESSADHCVTLVTELQRREVSCVVGAASGVCYCGVVGCDVACRWDITGWACVRACRLMQHAELSGLRAAFDRTTACELSDLSLLEVHSEGVHVKGTADPITVYSLSNYAHEAYATIAMINDFAPAVRAKERDLLRQMVLGTSSGEVGTPLTPLKACDVAVVVGGVASGKKFLILSALHGTSFVPIMHRTSTDSPQLSVSRTVACWFLHHPDEAIRSIAERTHAAASRGLISRTLELTRDLMETTIRCGLHTAIIVDRAQYIDTGSMRLIRDSILYFTQSRNLESPHGPGRFLWMFSMTPIFGGCSVAELETYAQRVRGVATITLSPLSLHELDALCTFFSGTSSAVERTAAIHRKSDGVPGLAWKIMKWTDPVAYDAGAKKLDSQFEYDSDSAAFVCTEDGKLQITQFGEELLRTMNWRSISNSVKIKLSHFVDVLPPSHLILLKVIASITGLAEESNSVTPPVLSHCSSDVVCLVAGTFIHSSRPEELERALRVLRDLLLIYYEAKNSTCCFRLGAMREVVYDRLTPEQVKSVCRKAAEVTLSLSKQLTPANAALASLLLYRAGEAEACAKTLMDGWKLYCSDPPAGEDRVAALLWRAARKCNLVAELAALAAQGVVPTVSPNETGINCQTPSGDSGSLSDVRSPVYVSLNNDRNAHFVTLLRMRPPLVLGPLSGLLSHFTRRVVWQYTNSTRRGHNLTPPIVDTVKYVKLLAKFDRVVFQSNHTMTPPPTTHAEEQDSLQNFLRQPQTRAQRDSQANDFIAYFERSVQPRARAVTTYIAGVKKFPLDQFTLPGTDETKALLRAFGRLCTGGSDSLRLALMDLAVVNWTTPYPYMTVAKLRDAWFWRWVSTDEVKAIVYLFLLDVATERTSPPTTSVERRPNPPAVPRAVAPERSGGGGGFLPDIFPAGRMVRSNNIGGNRTPRGLNAAGGVAGAPSPTSSSFQAPAPPFPARPPRRGGNGVGAVHAVGVNHEVVEGVVGFARPLHARREGTGSNQTNTNQ